MRIRTIKPEFWHHPVMARLPDDVQLLALGLLSMADDEGYFRADVEIVRGEVAPFRENLARVRECLAELSRVGWIVLSRSREGGEIGKVVTWEKHQRVDHPSPSKLKAYFLASNSRESREDSRQEQGTGNREQGSLIPPTPQGGTGDSLLPGIPVAPPPPERNGLHPEQLRLNAIFGRRPTTRWSAKEVRAWKFITPINEEDFQAIERYYGTVFGQSEKDYRRRDLCTLLNNWSGEVDRAKNFVRPSCL